MNRIISGEELAALMHNTLRTGLDENGDVQVFRFTAKQTERYIFDSNKGTHGNYGPVTTASSGAVLSFVTDSSFAGFNFTWKDVIGYPYACFDFYVDGVHCGSRYMENPRYSLMAFRLPEGTHRVELFLPWNSDTRIRSLELDGDAVLLPAPPKSMRILSFGDSITQGYIGVHPAYSYVNILGRKMNAEVLNQAIGGYYFEKESLDPELSAWKPDLITVAYGTNDFTHCSTLSEYREHCGGFMEKLAAVFPGVRVLGIMPIARMDERFEARLLMRSYSHADAMQSIRDVYAAYPETVTVLEDTYYPRDKDFFYADGLHPNDQGFLVYGDAVTRAVERMGFPAEAGKER